MTSPARRFFQRYIWHNLGFKIAALIITLIFWLLAHGL
jgi:hypothetical protein